MTAALKLAQETVNVAARTPYSTVVNHRLWLANMRLTDLLAIRLMERAGMRMEAEA